MSKEKNKEDRGFASGIFLSYAILILHVLLLILVGVAVVFFRGVVEYMPWILGGGAALILISGFWFFRRFKQNTAKLREVLSDPVFRDRAVEVKLLGGMASVRLGQPRREVDHDFPQMIQLDESKRVMQLEDPEAQRMRRLDQLVRLLDKELISPEEFAQLKKEILGSRPLDIN